MLVVLPLVLDCDPEVWELEKELPVVEVLPEASLTSRLRVVEEVSSREVVWPVSSVLEVPVVEESVTVRPWESSLVRLVPPLVPCSAVVLLRRGAKSGRIDCQLEFQLKQRLEEGGPRANLAC